MKKAVFAVLPFVLAAALLFGGCSSNRNASDGTGAIPAEYGEYDWEVTEEAEAPQAYPEEAGEDQAAADAGGGSELGGLGSLANSPAVNTTRKIIYRAEFEIETTAFEGDYAAIMKAVADAKGFVSDESTRGTKPVAFGDEGRVSTIMVRIPIEQYNTFIDTIGGVGQVLSRNQNTEDVTTSYQDREARIEMYQTHYDKLMTYLDKATKMEEIIALESEISETIFRLEELKGEKRYVDDQIEYTTVTISLSEVVEAKDVKVSEKTVSERASSAFQNSLKSLGVFFENLYIGLVAILPVLVVLAVIAAITLAIVLPLNKRSKRKRQEHLKRLEESKKQSESKDGENK